MADIEFDKQRQVLNAFGRQWRATSGVHGSFDSLPIGSYLVPANALMAGTPGLGVAYHEKYNRAPFPFRDGLGLSWFLWLGLRNLGLHPDGNVPGTEGCIGIQDANTRPLFEDLRLRSRQPMTVLVFESQPWRRPLDHACRR